MEFILVNTKNEKMINQIWNIDCLDGMSEIEDNSIDMILCDLPYGTTQCKWDTIIPFEDLWNHYNRIIKENGAIVLTSAQPFTSLLVSSNIRDFRYSWVWEKSKATGYLNSKKRPLIAHEDILVFYKKQPTYNPQMVIGKPYNKGKALRTTNVYGKQKETLVENKEGLRYPRTVQYFKTAESEGKVFHPTQKPIELFKYIIKTYTNEGDVVLDNCIGSGTTAIASIATNRNYIGFEKDKEYYKLSLERDENFINKDK
jgi:DNA modification methylase